MAVDIGDSSRAHTIVRACVVLPVLTFVFIVLRIWSRVFVLHSLGWDDCKRRRYLLDSELTPIDTAAVVLVGDSWSVSCVNAHLPCNSYSA